MDNHVNIKIADEKDIKAIAQILDYSFKEFKENYTNKAYNATVIANDQIQARMKKGRVWLADIRNVPVGTVAGYINAETFMIQGMAVLPTARGKRIGYLLLNPNYAIENLLRLESTSKSIAMLRFSI